MRTEEARKLNDIYAATQHLDIDSIYKKIKEAAVIGRTSVSISLEDVHYSYRTRMYTDLKKSLNDNGYTVSRSTWSGDYRDPLPKDDIFISWS
jgi:hypothetical protein